MFDVLSELESKRAMMTPREVADLMRVSHRTVQRMIAANEIPTILFGGQRRIDPAALHRYVRKKCPGLVRGREKDLKA